MEKRRFGRTEMEVSALGFGGAEIGFERATPETAKRLLVDALDAGLNLIDTAECYLASEELIGEAVSDRRDDYYLFTKCGHAEGPGIADWHPESLLASIVRSLRRLKTDRVDLVQLHSCSEDELRKGDVIAALQTAREKGYTRYIGYSGDGLAARFAVECGAFDSLQTSINIADQEAISSTIPLARERGMAVIAKRPLANAVWRFASLPDNTYVRPYWERLRKLDYEFLRPEATEGDLTRSISTALRFTLGVPGVTTAIVGTAKPGRWRQNAAMIGEGPLSTAEYEEIRRRWQQVAGADWHGEI